VSLLAQIIGVVVKVDYCVILIVQQVTSKDLLKSVVSIVDLLMKTLFQRLIGGQAPVCDYSSVMVVYQTEDRIWRGFVMPFDITFEVIDVLKEMTDVYVDGLKKYNHPNHLSDVPLSSDQDNKKWLEVSQELTNKLLNRISKVDSPSYYAEAQLPA
jgi:hypothetical protein